MSLGLGLKQGSRQIKGWLNKYTIESDNY